MSPRKNPEAEPSVEPEAPTTTHKFVGEHPLIFPDLHHGIVHLVRANPDLDEAGEPIPESGIVVLREGDELILPEDYAHAWLERINVPAKPDTTETSEETQS